MSERKIRWCSTFHLGVTAVSSIAEAQLHQPIVVVRVAALDSTVVLPRPRRRVGRVGVGGVFKVGLVQLLAVVQHAIAPEAVQDVHPLLLRH